jgi:hypothetical protein
MQPPCLNCRPRATLPLAALESRRPGKLSFPRALFKITDEEARKVPTCPRGYEDHDRRGEETHFSKWVELDETDTALIHKINPSAVRPAAILALSPEIMRLIGEFYPAEQIDDLADILAMNRGGFVNAGPGTGKTRALMPRLIRAILARNPEAEIYKVAPTFVAAKQMRGGITCQAAVHRLNNNRVRNVVLIVDEVSMCNTAIMEAMARWSIQGGDGPVEHPGRRVLLLRRFLPAPTRGRRPRDEVAHGGQPDLHAALQQLAGAPREEPPGRGRLRALPVGHVPPPARGRARGRLGAPLQLPLPMAR